MLNSNTRTVLQALSNINTQAIISYPVTGIKMGGSISAFVNLETLGESQFEEFGIFNIPEFINIAGILGKDVEINMDEDKVFSIQSANSKIRYKSTNVSVLEDTCKTKLDMIDRIKDTTRGNENVISFNLPKEELERIKKISSALTELTQLHITSNDGEVTLTARDKTSGSNSISTTFAGETADNISTMIVMPSLAKIPNTGYDVSIIKSSKGSYISVFESTDIDGLGIVIPVEKV